MATIAIAPHQELGHILPALQMAKGLRQAGHRVVFVGLADCRAMIAAEDFEYVAICDDVLPDGALDAVRARARVHSIRAALHVVETSWRATAAISLLTGREHARLAAIGADLALCDRDWEEPRLVFAALGARVMTYAANLCQPRRPWSPPAPSEVVTTALDAGLLVRAAGHVGTWWTIVRERRALRRALARRGPLVALVLCPPELDEPRRVDPGSHHVGPCIDVTRRAAPLDIAIDPTRPLVYCAVGSQGHRLTDTHFIRASIEAARVRDWQLLISVGASIDPSRFGPLPDGVTIRRELPQLAVLAHARAAIIHGGLGTIKECIWFGVPMLVLPGDYDQPANGRRVEHHGLGVTRSRAHASAAVVGTLVADLLDDSTRRERVTRWGAVFQDQQRQLRHVALVAAELTRR